MLSHVLWVREVARYDLDTGGQVGGVTSQHAHRRISFEQSIDHLAPHLSRRSDDQVSSAPPGSR